jgi:two-component system response regulator CpxR
MQDTTLSILLVDDDAELCALMQEILRPQRFELHSVHDGAAGLAAARAGTFDLAILDIMLPVMDGFQVLRELRRDSELPVIMLTSRTASLDRIAGLELGADDYLPKPFEPRELSARIRTILRRARKQSSSQGEIIEVPPIRIDTAQRRVWRALDEIEVTSVEFVILDALMRSAGHLVSRADLTHKLYGRQPSGFDRSIEVHICHLRKKLESDVPLIRTIRGSGYQFCAGGHRA